MSERLIIGLIERLLEDTSMELKIPFSFPPLFLSPICSYIHKPKAVMEESTVKEALPRVEQQNPQEPELANKLPDKLQSKEDFYESVILVLQECFIYKIPPRMGIAGYKASEWE